MATYCVTYDLRAPGRNYQPLWDALAGINAVRGLQSTWFVDSSHSATAIRDYLRRFIDQNDGIVVIEIGPGWATYSAPTSAGWLSARHP
jgi:hypothetical protein